MADGEKKSLASFWDFLRWLLLRPKVSAALLAVVVVVYVGLRVAGYDLIPPLLAKLGMTTVSRRLNISGDWKYRCTVIGGPFHEWGGRVRISQETTGYGVQWKLYGQRLWETTTDDSGKQKTQQLPTSYPWETNWGVITAEPSVRFTYRISTADGTIEGYSYGEIEETAGVPDRIVGKFYQLPPYEPVHGRLDFRRMINASDLSW